MKMNAFTLCATDYIARLRKEGRHSTAHVYKNALRSFTVFCGTEGVSFSQVSRENLRCYYLYLVERGNKLNTISTYMRMLRSIYNRGVDANETHYVHGLFSEVFTGVDVLHKKALPIGELQALLYSEVKSDKLRHTQAIANLLFQFCGMSFADFAHLEKKNLQGSILSYHRIKTGTPISIELLDTAQPLIRKLLNKEEASPGYPDYLFSVLSGKNKRRDEEGYKEYQSALRRFNEELKELARACHISSKVTSYSLRHSWATTAKFRGVPIEMISESLGHKSIKTTQIYLKAFDLEKRTTVNRMNISYVKNYKKRRMEYVSV